MKCEKEGCSIRASYGKQKIKHCKDHSSPGSKLLRIKKCIEFECNERACFGVNKALHCRMHASKGSINHNQHFCEFFGCKIQASFGNDGTRKFCSSHAPEGSIRLTNKRNLCVSCILLPKNFASYKSLTIQCRECDPVLFNTYKKKEDQFQAVLEEKGFIHSKNDICTGSRLCFRREFPVHLKNCGMEINKSDCGTKASNHCRMDFVMESSNIVIIVEIDEHQHEERCIKSEVSRANECVSSFFLGGNQRPVLLLRINPDKYTFNGDLGKVKREERYERAANFITHKLSLTSEELDALGYKPEHWKMIYMYFDSINDKAVVTTKDDFDVNVALICSALC